MRITEHPADLLQAGCVVQEAVPQLDKRLTQVRCAQLIRHRGVPEGRVRVEGEEERVRILALCRKLGIVVDRLEEAARMSSCVGGFGPARGVWVRVGVRARARARARARVRIRVRVRVRVRARARARARARVRVRVRALTRRGLA